ncbi:MAG: DNA polymerase III subunit gamma/tau [Deltaproteobacteria bacterium]|nr:DNA polymerase III subunit gamma/tau [Deltaproteobacteria bacterium]MBW2051628.1 DNA polymerase III subunit gamma/tau [Deltaproteobacteria bacterium]MBW2141583.1 DNA polymerase III subunit gamma/tau [Deltaproteobacteria bacterium]MBW2323043.1 DNA polymerase III subunit gamma/tau [Deltaproteobacteria bacterium]
MSYLVLARKYRPLVFTDVVGQEHVTRPLINALKIGRVAHAYLFSGTRGVGKTTVARLLSMALNCQTETDQPPCGHCDTCNEISSGQAIDVFEIDGASNRGIDEVRELRETVKYLPSKGSFKVYIIDEVHMLTTQAFNALLKTLEEPPAHVVFIFATTEPHKVPATILSRCQRYDFKRIALKEIVGRLEKIAATEGIEISTGSLRIIARESEGSLRDSLSLLDQVIAFSGTEVSDESVVEALGLIDRALISGAVKALLSGNAGQTLEILDQIYNYGYDTKEFVTQLVGYLRSLVVSKVSQEPGKILDLFDVELEELKEIAVETSLETLNFLFSALLDSLDDLRRATRPRLALEALMISLAQVEPVQPLAELVSRMETLLESAGPGFPGSDPKPSPGVSPEHDPGAVERFVSEASAQTEPPLVQDTFPAPAPINRSVPERLPRWSNFLSSIKEKNNRLLFSLLEKAETRLFTPETVELHFATKAEINFIKSNQDHLVDLLNEYFKTRPKLKIDVSSNEADSLKANMSDEGANSNKKAEEAIRNHPMFKSASELLGARLIRIIPNDE